MSFLYTFFFFGRKSIGVFYLFLLLQDSDFQVTDVNRLEFRVTDVTVKDLD